MNWILFSKLNYELQKIVKSLRLHFLFYFLIVVLLQLFPYFPRCSPLPRLFTLSCSPSQSPHRCPCPWVLYTCSSPRPFPVFPPVILLGFILIIQFNKYLLTAIYVLGTVLAAWDTSENETDKGPCPYGPYIHGRGEGRKESMRDDTH